MSIIDDPMGNHLARFIKRIEDLERENADLEQTIENLRATVWGTEFELEKAKQEADRLRTVLRQSKI